MRKLLLFAIVLMPIACSGTLPEPTTPTSIDVCRVLDPGPAPALHPVEGCLPIVEEVALATWIVRAGKLRAALAGCSHVQLETP